MQERWASRTRAAGVSQMEESMSLPEGTRDQRDDDELNRFVREMQKQGRRFWAYARSRSTECWLFFAAGLVLGLFVG